MGKAGRYGNRTNRHSSGASEVAWKNGFRKARKIVPNTCKDGEVVITKPADPEKIKAWRESDEYKKYQQNQQRWRG